MSDDNLYLSDNKFELSSDEREPAIAGRRLSDNNSRLSIAGREVSIDNRELSSDVSEHFAGI